MQSCLDDTGSDEGSKVECGQQRCMLGCTVQMRCDMDRRRRYRLARTAEEKVRRKRIGLLVGILAATLLFGSWWLWSLIFGDVSAVFAIVTSCFILVGLIGAEWYVGSRAVHPQNEADVRKRPE
jgi:hypothetical protein